MSEFAARAPDYKLVLVTKEKKHRRGLVGKAWKNNAGGISVTLEPGVVLSWRDCEDCFLGLYPLVEVESGP